MTNHTGEHDYKIENSQQTLPKTNRVVSASEYCTH